MDAAKVERGGEVRLRRRPHLGHAHQTIEVQQRAVQLELASADHGPAHLERFIAGYTEFVGYISRRQIGEGERRLPNNRPPSITVAPVGLLLSMTVPPWNVVATLTVAPRSIVTRSVRSGHPARPNWTTYSPVGRSFNWAGVLRGAEDLHRPEYIEGRILNSSWSGELDTATIRWRARV